MAVRYHFFTMRVFKLMYATTSFFHLFLCSLFLLAPLSVQGGRIDALYSETVTGTEVADVCAMIRESLEKDAELNAPVLIFLSLCERAIPSATGPALMSVCAHLAAAYTVARAAVAVPYNREQHEQIVAVWQERMKALETHIENAFEIERLIVTRKALLQEQGGGGSEVRPLLQKVRAEINRLRNKQNNLVTVIANLNEKLCVDHRPLYKKGALYRIVGYGVGALCVTIVGLYALKMGRDFVASSMETHPWKWAIGSLFVLGGTILYCSRGEDDEELLPGASDAAQHHVETRGLPVVVEKPENAS